MELTVEILQKNGFESNHPERVLGNYIIHGVNPEYRVSVERQYKTLSNELGFVVACWKCDSRGAIIRRSSGSFIDTVEELQTLIDLCHIDKKIITEDEVI